MAYAGSMSNWSSSTNSPLAMTLVRGLFRPVPTRDLQRARDAVSRLQLVSGNLPGDVHRDCEVGGPIRIIAHRYDTDGGHVWVPGQFLLVLLDGGLLRGYGLPSHHLDVEQLEHMGDAIEDAPGRGSGKMEAHDLVAVVEDHRAAVPRHAVTSTEDLVPEPNPGAARACRPVILQRQTEVHVGYDPRREISGAAHLLDMHPSPHRTAHSGRDDVEDPEFRAY